MKLTLAHLLVGVGKSIHIQHRHNVPIMTLGQFSHQFILRREQLVDEPRGCGGGNPFACMYIGLDKDTRIARLIRYLQATNGPSLIRLANFKFLCDSWICREYSIQPSFDLSQIVVTCPAKCLSSPRICLTLNID